jgi:hypothetical protein
MANNAMTIYWTKIRAMAAEFDPESATADVRDPGAKNLERSEREFFLTSTGNEMTGQVGGRVYQMGPYLAARSIIDRTHRLSTPEEIEAWRTEMAQRKEAIERAEQQRQTKGNIISVDSGALAAAIAAIMQPAKEAM